MAQHQYLFPLPLLFTLIHLITAGKLTARLLTSRSNEVEQELGSQGSKVNIQSRIPFLEFIIDADSLVWAISTFTPRQSQYSSVFSIQRPVNDHSIFSANLCSPQITVCTWQMCTGNGFRLEWNADFGHIIPTEVYNLAWFHVSTAGL